MIMIAGGTGRLGRLVVRRLISRGQHVRVLTRDRDRATALGADVEVVIGDVRNRSTLEPAMDGVEVVVSLVHGFAGPGKVTPATVDRDGNMALIDAAGAAGADVVMMSTVGASPDHPMELFRMKDAAEQYLRASRVASTVVAATAYLELWLEILDRTAARSGRPIVFGRGENPINFVSVDDVAAVVELAVLDRGTRGIMLETGGEENLTFNHLAAALQSAAGRPGAPRHVPPAALRLMAATVGRINPTFGGQLRAALAMDATDMRFDPSAIRIAYPQLPTTSLTQVLAVATGARFAQ